MKQRLLQLWSGLVGLSALAMAHPALAAIDVYARPVTLNEITDYINYAVEFLYGIGGVIVAGFIIWGAIRWTTAGGDDGKVTEAKQIILNAIYGALVLFGVWVILATVKVIISRGFFN